MINHQIPIIQYLINPPPKVEQRKRPANRDCCLCGDRMYYYPELSTPKAPNEFRIMTYYCPNCTEDSDFPLIVKMQISEVPNPLRIVNLEIKHTKRKLEALKRCQRTRKRLAKKIEKEANEELEAGNLQRAEQIRKNMISNKHLSVG